MTCYNLPLLNSWGMRLETNKYYLLSRQSMSEWYTRIITAVGGRIAAAVLLKYANFYQNRIRALQYAYYYTHPLTHPLAHTYTCTHIIIEVTGLTRLCIASTSKCIGRVPQSSCDVGVWVARRRN